VKTIGRGGFVLLEGDQATSLNVLAAGRMKVIRETDEGRKVILRQIDPGEIFGGAGGWGGATYPAQRPRAGALGGAASACRTIHCPDARAT
jgi:CRP-like cAMP-binding protein